jgi:RNA-directed DNA polymerase
VIDDESCNTRKYPETSEEALSQGEGGAGFRFYQLYDKIYREDICSMPTDWCVPIRGAGVDEQTFEMIKQQGGGVAVRAQEELRTKTYKPQPVRRLSIPKPGGGERPLGIPTIRDRVVQ